MCNSVTISLILLIIFLIDHKCHVVPPETKVDCGSPPGITRIQCEQEKNCCFDESPAQGAPICYQGIPSKSTLNCIQYCKNLMDSIRFLIKCQLFFTQLKKCFTIAKALFYFETAITPNGFYILSRSNTFFTGHSVSSTIEIYESEWFLRLLFIHRNKRRSERCS